MEHNQNTTEKPPFYPHSYAESLRMESEGAYRQSMAANVACRDAIVDSIAQHFDGYRLGQVAKAVIAEYGFDRVAYVLANTIQKKGWDGRFSPENKVWSKEIFVPEDLIFGVDQRISFLADCSPGLLNLFTDQYREEVSKLNLWDKSQVYDASEVDFKGKLMVLKPETLKETSRTRENQLFYCTGGVGCLPGKQGRTVSGQFQDGQKASFAREDFLGLPREEFLHQEEPETDRIAFALENGFLELHSTDEGNAYTFYDETYNLIDGGEHDDPEWTVYDVARDILAEGDVPPFADLSQFKQMDYEELMEKADNVAMSKIVGTIKYSAVTNSFIASDPKFEDSNLPLYTNTDGEQFAFGYGHLGNGTTVWNFLDETGGDYTTVAHISESGELTYHKDFDQRLPLTAKEALFQQAEQVRKEQVAAQPVETVLAVTDDDLRGKIAYDGYEIAVEGHLGTWYVVDATAIHGTDYFLLEHEEHGDEAACIIVDVEGKVVLDDVWNGFEDLEYFLESQTVNTPVQTPENPPYQLPDSTVSIADSCAYGYTAEELLPMEKDRTLELFGEGFAIYALHPDNTEAMIFEEEEIIAHEGLFGIEKEDWTAHLELEVMKDYNRRADHSPVAEPATYTIYQLSKDEANHYHRFTSLETLEREGLSVRKEGYDEIYSAPISNPNDSDTKILNQLYEQFNINHPADFKGHSLSVSDIIALQRGSVVSYHYVDSYGFTELPNYLQTAELSTEQNYNMVDGQINNLPTKQNASQDKPISLMERLDATRREQQQKPAPKKENAPKRDAEMER